MRQTWIAWTANLQILLMLVTLSCFSWWILIALITEAEQPVFVNGDLSTAERAELAQRLAGNQRMATLRRSLKRIPWVETAHVRKDLQGRILIQIEAAPLLAYLPHRGYLLASGTLVNLPLERAQGVPKMEIAADFNDQDLGQATRILPQLGTVLAKHGLSVQAYRVGRGGNLQVAIKQGPALILGTHSHATRLAYLDRFLLEYREDLDRIQRIDLRHEKALAVRWK